MTNNYQRAFLDYYGHNKLSPVNQNLGNLESHFTRRAALYRHLGLPPHFIKGMRVLEVGPGTGQNSIFTYKQQPQKYTLLDGNPESIKQAKLNFSSYFSDTSSVEFIETDFLTTTFHQHYDLVLCEGTLPGQYYPSKFLQKLSSYVNPGGVIVITCCDPTSIMADMLRKVAAALLLKNDLSCNTENVEALRTFCNNSMKNLKGMSRLLDDWIYDVILHPFIGQLFSIEQAVDCLEHEFDVYFSSPQFSIDWRWYKELTHESNFNHRMKSQYLANVHNLLDNRYELPPISESKGKMILSSSKDIFNACQTLLNNPLTDRHVAHLNQNIKAFTEAYACNLNSETVAALVEFSEALNSYIDTAEFNLDMPHFEQWFSRGQQYLSFMKRPI